LGIILESHGPTAPREKGHTIIMPPRRAYEEVKVEVV
jgi:hypothetical protein